MIQPRSMLDVATTPAPEVQCIRVMAAQQALRLAGGHRDRRIKEATPDGTVKKGEWRGRWWCDGEGVRRRTASYLRFDRTPRAHQADENPVGTRILRPGGARAARAAVHKSSPSPRGHLIQSVHVRRGDTVGVIAGKEGQARKVLRVRAEKGRVLVEHVNMIKKHQRPRRSCGRAHHRAEGRWLSPMCSSVPALRQASRSGVKILTTAARFAPAVGATSRSTGARSWQKLTRRTRPPPSRRGSRAARRRRRRGSRARRRPRDPAGHREGTAEGTGPGPARLKDNFARRSCRRS